MVNELRADLKLTGDQQFKRGLKDVGDSADKAGDQLTDLGKDAGFLAKQAAEAETQIKVLIKTLNETGDLSLLKAIRKEKRQLRLFENLAQELEQELASAAVGVAGAATEAGVEIGGELVKGTGRGVAAGGPYLIAALAALALAAAPGISAILSGAILGAAGAGGLVGGIVAAAQDQRVKDAGTEFGKSFSAGFKDLGAPFVEPTIDSLDRLSKKLASVQYGDLGAGIRGLSTSVSTLTTGVEGFIDTMEPGLVSAMRAGEKVLNVLAAELPGFGEDISTMFERLDASSDGAAMGMKTLLDVGGDVLIWTGNLLGFFADLYEAGVKFGAGTTGALEDVFNWLGLVIPPARILAGWMGDLNNHFEVTAESATSTKWPRFETNLKNIAGTAEHAADEFKKLAEAIDDAFDSVLDIHEQTISYNVGLLAMKKELLDGAKTLSIYTEEGLKNRDALIDQIRETEAMRTSNAASAMGAEEATRVYEQQITALEKWAIANGFNAAEVRELTRAVLGVPASATTEFRYPGLLEAIAAARELRRLLGGYSGNLVSVQVGDVYGAGGGAYVSGRASGGPVEPHKLYRVNESGVEILQTGSQGGYVLNAQQSAAMMSGASGGSRPVVNITFQPSGNSAMDQIIAALWPHILKQVRIDGGDLAVFGAA